MSTKKCYNLGASICRLIHIVPFTDLYITSQSNASRKYNEFICRLIHIGQFLNGLGGPIAMGAPPAISAEWFPPEQRTTATAISTLSNTMGNAVSFLLGTG